MIRLNVSTEHCKNTMQLSKTRKKIFLNYIKHRTSQEQYDIICAPLSNQRIIACAGSGKTTTLIYRLIGFLVDGQTGAQDASDASDVILTTFTREASKTLKERLIFILSELGFHDIVKNVNESLIIGTMDAVSRGMLIDIESSLLKRDVLNDNDIQIRKYIGNCVDSLHVSEYMICLCYMLRSKLICSSNPKLLIVDEFQDLNSLQFEWIKLLSGNNTNLVAVGDDCQNIYSFRNSDPKYLLELDKMIDNLQTFYLTTNYRSSVPILNLANSCIRHIRSDAKMYPPISTNTHPNTVVPKLPVVVHLATFQMQFNFIYQYATKLKQKHGYRFCDMAILARNNVSLLMCENYFCSIGVPTLLVEEATEHNDAENSLCMGTIHKSKGLEWQIVFVIGLDDDFFPTSRDTLESIMDERRLFYVAVSRARERLFLIHTTTKISRFIKELEPSTYEPRNIKYETIQFQELAKPHTSKNTHTTVSNILRSITGEQLFKMRQDKIIGHVDWKETQVHEPLDIPKQVIEFSLSKELGNFFDTYITRELVRLQYFANLNHLNHLNHLNSQSGNIFPTTKANDMFSSVVLCKNKYTRYQDAMNIDKNIMLTKKIPQILVDVKSKQLELSVMFGIPIQQIPVIQESVKIENVYINRIRPVIQACLLNYMDKTKKSIDIIHDIYLISCVNELANRRLRVFYQSKLSKWITDIRPHLEKIDRYLASIQMFTGLEPKKSVNIVHNGTTICGEIDILTNNDTCWELKASKQHFSVLWELQLVLYSNMLQPNQSKQFNIYNPILGTFSTCVRKQMNESTFDVYYKTR